MLDSVLLPRAGLASVAICGVLTSFSGCASSARRRKCSFLGRFLRFFAQEIRTLGFRFLGADFRRLATGPVYKPEAQSQGPAAGFSE